MPYLTVWDRISQNLVHLEDNSHKIVQLSQNFHTILQHILWRNKHKSHFVVFITSFLHLNKAFWLLLGCSKVIFVKISQDFFALSHRFQSSAYGMYAINPRNSDTPKTNCSFPLIWKVWFYFSSMVSLLGAVWSGSTLLPWLVCPSISHHYEIQMQLSLLHTKMVSKYIKNFIY